MNVPSQDESGRILYPREQKHSASPEGFNLQPCGHCLAMQAASEETKGR